MAMAAQTNRMQPSNQRAAANESFRSFRTALLGVGVHARHVLRRPGKAGGLNVLRFTGVRAGCGGETGAGVAVVRDHQVDALDLHATYDV